MSTIFDRFLNSPTLMTWGNFLAKSLSLIILLPLVVTILDISEIVIWYLFTSIVTIQLLLDLGFTPSFVRLIAYSMGGVHFKEFVNLKQTHTSKVKSDPDWESVSHITHAMKVIYIRMALMLFVISAIFGSWALWGPISESVNPQSAWFAWLVIVLISPLTLFGNFYLAILQGLNLIAKIQRWNMYIAILSIVSSSIVLFLSKDLFWLVLTQQFWLLTTVLVNRYLKQRQFQLNHIKEIAGGNSIDRTVWNCVWPATWRSGIGLLLSAGLIQLSGIIYAQLAEAKAVASYLLGLQMIRYIANFSNAPFYSKIPLISKLYAMKSQEKLIGFAAQGMRLSFWTYVAGFMLVGLLGDTLLELIGSNADFPSLTIWLILGLAIFFERYGGMHIQLYSTSNHIIWHIANGVSGLIMIVTSILLFAMLDVLAFPVAMLIGNLGFYSWYAAYHSYRTFNLSFARFESTVMIPPFLILLCYIVFHYVQVAYD